MPRPYIIVQPLQEEILFEFSPLDDVVIQVTGVECEYTLSVPNGVVNYSLGGFVDRHTIYMAKE